MVQNLSIARNIGNIAKRTHRLLKLWVLIGFPTLYQSFTSFLIVLSTSGYINQLGFCFVLFLTYYSVECQTKSLSNLCVRFIMFPIFLAILKLLYSSGRLYQSWYRYIGLLLSVWWAQKLETRSQRKICRFFERYFFKKQ